MVRLATAVICLSLVGCAEMGQFLTEVNQMQQPQRNYVTQPFTPLQSPVGQPNTQQTTQQTSDEYQLVMVNTPTGVVYKRCKMLNGKAAYCI